MPRCDGADDGLGGRDRAHDLEPWRFLDGISGEDLLLKLLANSLEDPGGSYLSPSHGRTADGQFGIRLESSEKCCENIQDSKGIN